MLASRDFHAAMLLTAGLNAGKVLIAGGRSSSGKSYMYLAGAELYDPATGAFTAAGDLIAARYGHSAIAIANGPNAGKILLAGGANTTTVASAELYDPATGGFASTGALAARQNFTLFPFLSGVVAAGGRNGSTRLATAEIYADFSFLSAGSMTAPRSGHTATPLPGGAVLVAGGEGASGVSVSTAVVLK
jgi:Zn-dependent protease